MAILRIAIIEDDPIIAQFLSSIIIKLNCEPIILTHETSKIISEITAFKPDILLLDINLGTSSTEKAGLSIANLLIDKNISIIFITAYNDDFTINEATKYSPEAYITKPFSEENIRISLLLAIEKKIKSTKKAFICKLTNNCIFDLKFKTLYCNQQRIHLTRTEMDVLGFLCYNQERIISYDEFYNAIWYRKAVSDAALRELLSRLRKKIPDIFILNHSGIGYELRCM